jgi:hypothetical protein
VDTQEWKYNIESVHSFYSNPVLWDHRRVCGPSLTQTSLCGAYLYLPQKRLQQPTKLHGVPTQNTKIIRFIVLKYSNLIYNNPHVSFFYCSPRTSKDSPHQSLCAFLVITFKLRSQPITLVHISLTYLSMAYLKILLVERHMG